MEFDIKELGFSYNGSHKLFSNIDITLKDGDVLNVLGTNGSGKTTFARCLLNAAGKYEGEILFDGINSEKMSIKQHAEYIGYMGLGTDIPLQLTVADYVTLGNAVFLKYFETPSEIHIQAMESALKRIGIFHLRDRAMYTLSQGERQMASAARLLVQKPSVIIFDEPMASLDMANKKAMLNLLIQLKTENNIIINITHSPDHAFKLGGYAILMGKDGHCFGKVDEVLTETSLSKLYGVNIRIICDSIAGKIAVEC